MYCSEIQDLLFDDSDVSSARETGENTERKFMIVNLWNVGRQVRFVNFSSVSGTDFSQCRWSSVDSMVLLDCTVSTEEKGLQESEAFSKGPDTTIAFQNSEKNHPRNCDFYTNHSRLFRFGLVE